MKLLVILFLVNEIKRNDLIRARKFGYICRLVDCHSAINDGREFESKFKNIYPVELQLNKENKSSLVASFLDLQVKTENNKSTALLDPRYYDYLTNKNED